MPKEVAPEGSSAIAAQDVVNEALNRATCITHFLSNACEAFTLSEPSPDKPEDFWTGLQMLLDGVAADIQRADGASDELWKVHRKRAEKGGVR